MKPYRLTKPPQAPADSLLVKPPSHHARIAIPGWEPAYDLHNWHAFRRQMGYQPYTEHAYGKEVTPAPIQR